MSQYCERYEQKKKHNIEKEDKKLLKQLTTNVLFCPYCYMPYLKDKINKQLFHLNKKKKLQRQIKLNNINHQLIKQKKNQKKQVIINQQ
eukprot:414684_1